MILPKDKGVRENSIRFTRTRTNEQDKGIYHIMDKDRAPENLEIDVQKAQKKKGKKKKEKKARKLVGQFLQLETGISVSCLFNITLSPSCILNLYDTMSKYES